MSIREPAANGYSVLRMENIRRWRIINDYRILEVTSNLGEILYIVLKSWN